MTKLLPITGGATLAIIALVSIVTKTSIDAAVAALLGFGVAVAISPSISRIKFGKDGFEFETQVAATASTIAQALKTHDTAIAALNRSVADLNTIVQDLKETLTTEAAAAQMQKRPLSATLGQVIAPLGDTLLGVGRSLDANTGVLETSSGLIRALGGQVTELGRRIQAKTAG